MAGIYFVIRWLKHPHVQKYAPVFAPSYASYLHLHNPLSRQYVKMASGSAALHLTHSDTPSANYDKRHNSFE